MMQLHYRHVNHDPIRGVCPGGGTTEITVGPMPKREAQDRLLEHRAADVALGRHRPKNCNVTVEPYDGGRSFIPVCSPTCEQCASDEHNEVRDAS